jgi:hypothetical protein
MINDLPSKPMPILLITDEISEAGTKHVTFEIKIIKNMQYARVILIRISISNKNVNINIYCL